MEFPMCWQIQFKDFLSQDGTKWVLWNASTCLFFSYIAYLHESNWKISHLKPNKMLLIQIHLPFLTHSSTFSLASPTLSSNMPTPIFEWATPVSTNLVTLSFIRRCVSAITGNFSSYLQAKSPTLRIVIGMIAHPAPMPTASGNDARRRIFLFRTRIDEPIAAIRTYIPPGMSFSWEPFGGAREATVDVKDFSRLKASVNTLLVLSSAEAA
jgi:hypothetical protein